MPFTLAHPVAILPLVKSRYFHFPALFIGSMSPDFIYFLAGKPVHGGHQIFASAGLNLTLCALFYFLYQYSVAPILRLYLPQRLAVQFPIYRLQYGKSKLESALIFLYSAWLGMLSHIMLDAFTHPTGYFVQHYALLQQVYLLPIYKWLQYAGGVLGLSLILLFWLWLARKYPAPKSKKHLKQKLRYWLAVGLLSLGLFGMWQYLAFRPWYFYAEWIIRAIDCLILALVCINLSLKIIWKMQRKNAEKRGAL